MKKEEMKKYITDNLLSEKGKFKYSSLKNLSEEFNAYLLEFTKFVDTDNIKERIYYILNDITEEIICPCCKSNRPNFKSIKDGYYETCYVSCSAKYSASKAYNTKVKNNSFEKATIRNKLSKLEKYGDENYNNREKARATCLEKYSVEHHSKDEIIRSNTRRTCLEKYSVENVFQSKEIKDRIISTNIEKYGVRNFSQTGISENSGYKWKEYILPSGDKIKYQGYEDKLLDELLLEYQESEIITSRKDIPEIWYFDKEGTKRRYFPDVYIPKTNTIYEVKSEYTLNVSKEINELKFQAAKDAGFNFELRVY